MTDSADILAAEELQAAYQQITTELAKVVIGQRQVIEELLIAMFARGHCLLEGVPGLAKTLMIRTLADALDLQFSRIQFTPDLMPADITGTDDSGRPSDRAARVSIRARAAVRATSFWPTKSTARRRRRRPRCWKRCRSSRSRSAGERHPLPEPFFVLATQNPIEQEGTYPLPEAQLDRFMFHVWVDYPTPDEELEIIQADDGRHRSQRSRRLLNADAYQRSVRIVRRVPIADHVARYAMQFARLTRRQEPDAPAFVREYVQWGAGPRASQSLVLGGQSTRGADGPLLRATHDDIRAVARPVLRHRLKMNFNADATGITADEIVRRLLAHVPIAEEALPRGVP